MKKLFVLLCVLAVGSIVFAEGKVEEPKKEKPDYRSVIVDAWLVRVSADALYESGVKPFSEKDKENVSVMNLLWCLNDPNNGKVVVSATTRAAHWEEGVTEFRNTTYLDDDRGSKRNYGQNVNFRTESGILENKQLRIEWLFGTTFISYGKNNCRPDTSSVDYKNVTIVSAKKPVIVAQTQIGNDMFFLVLRAEIVD